MRFIHSSDFHLGKKFTQTKFNSSYHHQRRDDIWKSVEQMVKLANHESVDYVLLCGDLYEESNFTLGDMKRLMDLFALIRAKVFLIAGNHDPLRKSSLYHKVSLPKNVHLFGSEKLEKVEFENEVIYGISYNDHIFRKPDLLEGITLNHDKLNVLMIHTDCENPNERYLPFDRTKADELGFDYIALGHIHKPMIIDNSCAYPGSIEPLDFSETGYHFVNLVNLTQEDISYTPVQCAQSVFKIKEFVMDESFHYYDLIRFVEEEDEADLKVYLRIRLKGMLPEGYDIDLKELEQDLNSYIHFIEIEDQLVSNIDIQKMYELNQNNIVGYFIQEMQEKDQNNPIYQKALTLGLRALLDGREH